MYRTWPIILGIADVNSPSYLHPNKTLLYIEVTMQPSEFPTYPDLEGKVALITGIGQVGIPNSPTWGNGAATARVLSHNGVKLFGCDINLKAAEYTKQRLTQDNPDAVCDVMTVDVTKTADVDHFVKTAMVKYGRIDILINNVGVSRVMEITLLSCAS